MKQREEYRKTYNEIKSQEIKDEITNIEIMKVKCQARNQNLLQNIRNFSDIPIANPAMGVDWTTAEGFKRKSGSAAG